MASDGKIKESHPITAPPQIEAAAAAAAANPAAAASSSDLARAVLLVLAALTSASFSAEAFAAAAALRLSWFAVVAILVVFAMCFFVLVHIFSSFFLPRPPVAVAPQWEGIGAIAAVGVGIVVCFIAAGGSADDYAPACS
jgi:hypothetical protein